MDFEAAMSTVKANTGATGKDFDDLQETAKELGATTVFSASEAAEGMKYLGLAGWNAQDIISAMPGMLDLAAAGALELGTAADITSDTMQAFGTVRGSSHARGRRVCVCLVKFQIQQ
ncbi:phage tail tape measure protein [Paenibacillus larvae]|nr:phage tail tape measure protein [Paenibacillus larvae]MDT2306344.1 phage tail tape measure protein [Paenibacillus larvae]